ncbi:MAG: hypothetical protein HKM93_18465 [Desulfobacteraceae bacterium]|nr:hypothetical protein [Desulfobacteraceae bacterium]
MPVFSYLVYPKPGEKDKLHRDLERLDFCETMPAENEDLLILVTDTPDDHTEKKLQLNLKNMSSLQSLSMTFGHTD